MIVAPHGSLFLRQDVRLGPVRTPTHITVDIVRQVIISGMGMPPLNVVVVPMGEVVELGPDDINRHPETMAIFLLTRISDGTATRKSFTLFLNTQLLGELKKECALWAEISVQLVGGIRQATTTDIDPPADRLGGGAFESAGVDTDERGWAMGMGCGAVVLMALSVLSAGAIAAIVVLCVLVMLGIGLMIKT